MTDIDPMLFDPLQDGVPPDPYPLYDRLRREDPVHQQAAPSWLLAHYEDCWSLLRDPAMSSARRQTTGASKVVELLAAISANILLFIDPPDHTRLRGLVSKAFTPRVVERLRPRITARRRAARRTSRRAPSTSSSELGDPLPVTVIARCSACRSRTGHRSGAGRTRWPTRRSRHGRDGEPPELASAGHGVHRLLHGHRRGAPPQHPRDDLLSAGRRRGGGRPAHRGGAA